MSERTDITLRENTGDNPPDAITKIRERATQALEQLFDAGTEGGANWMKGKGEQEVAKATQIKTLVMTAIGQLELEARKQQQSKQKDADAREMAEKSEQNRHDERMYALKTERMIRFAEAMEKVAATVQRLHSLGVQVTFEQVAAMLPAQSGGGLSQER